MSRRLIFIAIFFSLYAIRYTLYASDVQKIGHVRVVIIQDAQDLSLKVDGIYKIIDPTGKKILEQGKNLKTTVASYKDAILLAGKSFNLERLTINVTSAGIITIDGRNFRGNIQLIKNNKGKLSVVNYIELDDYIKGILYHEASHYWPMEALKAQAIASRTYALYQMQKNKVKDFDVTNDTYSQVYGGQTSERFRTNQAVEETKDLILAFQGKPFPAFFHATCGGHTEDASRLWNIDIAPLKGVTCNYCKDSPHFNWHYVLALPEAAEKLQAAGYKISGIKEIVILGKDPSERITDLKIISGKKDLKISAKDFREAIGPKTLRSTNFSVNIIKDDVVFSGLGWGHGVGLCQWGAYFMAKQGFSAARILEYYYPQADVKTLKF